MDDVDILRGLLRSVYLTARQKEALRRVLGLIQRKPGPLVVTVKTTNGATRAEPSLDVEPLLGPGDLP